MIWKRLSIALLAALLLLSGLLGLLFGAYLLPANAQAHASESALEGSATPVYSDFREIPGVSEEEAAAVDALIAKYRQSGFSYGMFEGTSESYLRADGAIGGYTALFCEFMTKLFGIEFRPELHEWDTLIAGLENETVDFTGELTATEERKKSLYMTSTMTEREIVAYRLEGSLNLGEIARNRPLKYVFLAGSSTAEPILENSQYPIEALYAPSMLEASELVFSGEVDAFLAEEHGRGNMPPGMYDERIFPVVYSPCSFSTAKAELTPIIVVMDKFLAADGLRQLTQLYNQGNLEFAKDRLYSEFTTAERDYLAAHSEGESPIRLVVEDDNYPISFYNSHEEQWQGIAISVLDEICDFTGLRYEIVSTPEDEWKDNLAMLERGDVDMVSELMRSEEREGLFLWADEPYAGDNYSLISLQETEDVAINQVLYSRIGVVEGSAYYNFLLKWFPDHQHLVYCTDMTDAFNKLKSQEIDLVMSSCNTLLNASNLLEDPSFKNNLIFDFTFGSFYGFYKDETLLQSVLSKAQASVDTETIASRWTSRVFDYRVKLAQQQALYLGGLSVLFVIIIVLLMVQAWRKRTMHKVLEKTVRERTVALNEQTEAAEVASRAKGDFLSRMSHEIRTPLNAIIGMAQIAQKNALAESPKAAEAIDELLRASEHLLNLLNDILDMSKIEAGKLVLSREPFALTTALFDVRSIIAQRCIEKDIRFVAKIDIPRDLTVVGDVLHLRQVLINLLGNAVKFTEPGGEVNLTVATLAADDKSTTLSFVISDNGIGMSEEQVSRLFMPFEQADSSISTRFGGTGLGLTISQNLVRAMGGNIEVLSELGVGSTFSFTITLEKGTPQQLTDIGGETDMSRDWSGHRILLVEDVDVNRLILKELLTDTKISVDEVADGEAAVAAFDSKPAGYYDIILMDIMMPKLDGYEATRRIRALPRSDAAKIPIVAMTANAYNEDILKAREAGMNAHIAKPIKINDVIRKIDGYI